MKSRTAEEQAEAVLLRREEDRFRKRRSRAKATTLGISKQNHRAYSRLSSLHQAVNPAKKVLYNSPRKRGVVATCVENDSIHSGIVQAVEGQW